VEWHSALGASLYTPNTMRDGEKSPTMFPFPPYRFFLTMLAQIDNLELFARGHKMNCPTCNQPAKKFGKDRKGQQRYRCMTCKVTFIEPQSKPLGDMILAEDKAMSVLQHLVEGCSVRSTSRITRVHPRTILNLLALAGQKCEALMTERIHGLRVKDVQCDELWGYVGMKEKTKTVKGRDDTTLGDAWTFVGIERRSKLVLAWHLGRRTERDTVAFTEKLAMATNGSFQITTDGFGPYKDAVVLSLGAQGVDFAQLVKQYTATPESETRYSPAECIGCQKAPVFGNPDMSKVSTSHVERQNLTMRMQMRRLTRLTNAFSKKWEKLYAMLALYFAWYNFCRVHQTLRVTPAMEAGIADHIWEIPELLAATQE
jgi:transposase-like protein/IS1 family transposase